MRMTLRRGGVPVLAFVVRRPVAAAGGVALGAADRVCFQ